MKIATPYYLIDERKLVRNLRIMKKIREESGVKLVLALKCFSTWAVFDTMRKYIDGTTSSSLYEARLGREKFGKEVHAYSVAFSSDDIEAVSSYADKIIFNSVSQLKKYNNLTKSMKTGLRLNPGVSFSHFDLADPARRYSRLGVANIKEIYKVIPLISGAMFHFNCENNDFKNFSKHLDIIARKYSRLLSKLEWISLGGGLHFTGENYPLDAFCRKLKEFSNRFGLQIYLEPGEAVITRCAELVTKILDIVYNDIKIAIVDASTEAHMLDLLIYRIPAKINLSDKGRFKYMVTGRSCLAGDVFGTYKFDTPLKAGDILRIADAAGYSIVKKNWFNGLQMPSIVLKKIDGSIKIIRHFGYNDFLNNLS